MGEEPLGECDLGHKVMKHLSAESFLLFKKHWAMLWDSVTCRDTV